MDEEEKKGRTLTDDERTEVVEGDALFEMTRGKGWKVVEQWLTDLAFHSWVDPRGTQVKDEWIWQELNAFHACEAAKQLLQRINDCVNRADYLKKVEAGIIEESKKMRF